MQGNIYRHKCWKFKPYKVRGLFLSPIVVLEMVGSVVTEGFYTCSQAETQPCAVLKDRLALPYTLLQIMEFTVIFPAEHAHGVLAQCS